MSSFVDSTMTVLPTSGHLFWDMFPQQSVDVVAAFLDLHDKGEDLS